MVDYMVDISASNLESTATLLTKVRSGEEGAKERLCSIYLPLLNQWAHGRLPNYVRDLSETADMVQISLLNALNNIETFNPKHEGAFLAYLRKILLNSIRKEIRRHSNQGNMVNLGNEMELTDKQATIYEEAVGMEMFEKYESALSKLSENTKQAIILRVEFGFSYPEIAAALEINSANSARMAVTRAICKLAQGMK